MDNLKVFKKMGRYVAAQFNVINHNMLAAEQSSDTSMGLENQLIVDAWNTLTDSDCLSTTSAC